MKLKSSDQSDLMEVSSLRTEGDSLVVVGTIMGAMPIEAFLTPAELRQMFKLLSVGLVFFVIRMLFRR